MFFHMDGGQGEYRGGRAPVRFHQSKLKYFFHKGWFSWASYWEYVHVAVIKTGKRPSNSYR